MPGGGGGPDDDPYTVTPTQVEAFRRDGVVVLPDVFSPAEVEAATNGLAVTLQRHGVDIHDLDNTAHHLRKLSTTGGSGGVLDLFYPPWKLTLAQHPRFFGAISQLWAHTYAADPPADKEDGELYVHPFGPFDPTQGFFYLDRIGFRVPDTISQKHAKGQRPLQRSLTPHLDCCPSALYDSDKAVKRWRPIQSFVALTDNSTPDTGGFECVKGFHREFREWATRRAPCAKSGRPPPCVGDFTPIRPEEDSAVIARFGSVLYTAGSVVAFDWRIPHANASRHKGTVPRQVAYGSFLPDVPVNRAYAARQKARYMQGLQPDDQWKEDKDCLEEREGGKAFEFSALGRRLLGE